MSQTLLYKAAVAKKRLVLKALINHPLIEVDLSKVISRILSLSFPFSDLIRFMMKQTSNCPLLWVISAGDYKSMCILLKHPRFVPNDPHEVRPTHTRL